MSKSTPQAAMAAAPLSAEEARLLLQHQPSLRPLTVLWTQGAASVVFATLTALWAGQAAGYSAIYGGLCIIVPNIALLRGLHGAWSRVTLSRINPLGSLMAFLLWEGVKIVWAVFMLALAPKVATLWGGELIWIWLLMGLIVAAKSMWLAWLWFGRKKRPTVN